MSYPVSFIYMSDTDVGDVYLYVTGGLQISSRIFVAENINIYGARIIVVYII